MKEDNVMRAFVKAQDIIIKKLKSQHQKEMELFRNSSDRENMINILAEKNQKLRKYITKLENKFKESLDYILKLKKELSDLREFDDRRVVRLERIIKKLKEKRCIK